MFIKSFRIENFKSIKSMEIMLDRDLSVLTGVNNSGKTTIIEAMALWAECFDKLVHLAKTSRRGRFHKGDYILTGEKRYYEFSEINSIYCPNFQDIFFNLDTKRIITLSALVRRDTFPGEIQIGFTIRNSTQTRYTIELQNEAAFDYMWFNKMFKSLPLPVVAYYSSPIANIVRTEPFMTMPVIANYLAKKQSYEVMRNRLYKLYYTHGIFSQFQQDLSYILFGDSTKANVIITPHSDVNKDPNVIIRYSIGSDFVEKDIALLGSGSLQTMEILLNIYHQADDKKDINLILLDEPDSHIHHDVQRRLYEILSRKTDGNQIIITTHNESFIRNTPLQNLFHIDGTGEGVVRCLSSGDLPELRQAHFSGVYPDALSPIISELNGSTMGMDFVSAIESDLIVFVEGDDDARLLYHLFCSNIANKNKKIVFWVLGGVGDILKSIQMYKSLFSKIKNKKTLWNKSALVFDRDRLLNTHYEKLDDVLTNVIGIEHYCAPMYTQESVLLTDIPITAQLLVKAFSLPDDIEESLCGALRQIAQDYSYPLKNMMEQPDTKMVKMYRGIYIDPINDLLKAGGKIKIEDVELLYALQDFYKTTPVYRMATKDDVSDIINRAFKQLHIEKTFTSKNDFYRLVACADTSTQFEIWKKMIDFLTDVAKR